METPINTGDPSVFCYGRGRIRARSRVRGCRFLLSRRHQTPTLSPLPPSHTPRGVAAPIQGSVFAIGGRAPIAFALISATPYRYHFAFNLRFNRSRHLLCRRLGLFFAYGLPCLRAPCIAITRPIVCKSLPAQVADRPLTWAVRHLPCLTSIGFRK